MRPALGRRGGRTPQAPAPRESLSSRRGRRLLQQRRPEGSPAPAVEKSVVLTVAGASGRLGRRRREERGARAAGARGVLSDRGVGRSAKTRRAERGTPRLGGRRGRRVPDTLQLSGLRRRRAITPLSRRRDVPVGLAGLSTQGPPNPRHGAEWAGRLPAGRRRRTHSSSRPGHGRNSFPRDGRTEVPVPWRLSGGGRDELPEAACTPGHVTLRVPSRACRTAPSSYSEFLRFPLLSLLVRVPVIMLSL